MATATEDLVAFPDVRAAKIAKISMRRLRYWEQSGLVLPSIKRQLSPRNTVRLYSFQDLLALLVVSMLRDERKMPLQRIRRVVAHLRSRGYDAPLRQLTFATLGTEIYFQHADGSWEGDVQPDQIVFEETIRLDRLRAQIESAQSRSASDIGRIRKQRGVHSSAPIFAGTRIRLSTVQGYLQHGFSVEQILTSFPDLDAADVEEAQRLLSAAG